MTENTHVMERLLRNININFQAVIFIFERILSFQVKAKEERLNVNVRELSEDIYSLIFYHS